MTAVMNGRAPRKRKLKTRSGAQLEFTELGFGAAPLGNLYRPMTEKEARTMLELRMGFRHPLFRHRAALWPRTVRDAAKWLPARETARILFDLHQSRAGA